MAPDDSTNPNHHLWNNHGTWWVHATVLHGGIRQERVRKSLKTADPTEARCRRDVFLAELATRTDIRLSLRVGKPRSGNATRGVIPGCRGFIGGVFDSEGTLLEG